MYFLIIQFKFFIIFLGKYFNLLSYTIDLIKIKDIPIQVQMLQISQSEDHY